MRAQVIVEGELLSGLNHSLMQIQEEQPAEQKFMSLREIARHCESLGDGKNALCIAASIILDNIYQGLNKEICSSFMRYHGPVMEISILGLSLLVSQMPQLFEGDDLEFLLLDFNC